MKTHYELLGVDPSADAESVKKAFRREIAKYHPDKVTHLGAEFQEMASARAAELTAAYKILSDPEARSEYDEAIKERRAAANVAAPPPPRPELTSETESRADEQFREPPERRAPSRQFDEDRSSRDDLVRRATLARVRDALTNSLGDCDLALVRGFDLAVIPRPKPVMSLTVSQFFKRPVIPNVLVLIAPCVDGAVTLEAFGHAVRAKLDAKGKPVVLLLIGQELASAAELARAIEHARKKSPRSSDTIFPVPFDIRDWTAKMPLTTPPEIRALVERLKSSGD